jgi:catechol 2,3-dioxygenase-like lactoylglutathione lyase family enzyme
VPPCWRERRAGARIPVTVHDTAGQRPAVRGTAARRISGTDTLLTVPAGPREISMSGMDASNNTPMEMPEVGAIDMRLEVVTLPVSDVDRAKRFYQSLGWRLDADIVVGDAFRVVQLTPPHSACSIAFGKGVTAGEPGSVQRLILAVEDIDAARKELISRRVEVSEVFHLAGGRVPGPDPQGRSYQTYASFSDPDGNGWLLQEIKTRLPGREWED